MRAHFESGGMLRVSNLGQQRSHATCDTCDGFEWSSKYMHALDAPCSDHFVASYCFGIIPVPIRLQGQDSLQVVVTSYPISTVAKIETP